jgi:uncharacterized membrane protein
VTEATSTGVDARLSAVLCYAGWWVTGLVFLFAERRHHAVRFHAAQSSAVAFFVAVPTFQLLRTIGNVLWVAAVALWLVLLLKTWRGETWRLPLAGELARRIAAR